MHGLVLHSAPHRNADDAEWSVSLLTRAGGRRLRLPQLALLKSRHVPCTSKRSPRSTVSLCEYCSGCDNNLLWITAKPGAAEQEQLSLRRVLFCGLCKSMHVSCLFIHHWSGRCGAKRKSLEAFPQKRSLKSSPSLKPKSP
jgi:hypothetical protein